MREHEKLVTIERFENSFDAETAKMQLENEGIKCHLAGGDLLNTIPYLHTISVEIQVLEGDAERARAVLSRPSQADFDETEPCEDGQ